VRISQLIVVRAFVSRFAENLPSQKVFHAFKSTDACVCRLSKTKEKGFVKFMIRNPNSSSLFFPFRTPCGNQHSPGNFISVITAWCICMSLSSLRVVN